MASLASVRATLDAADGGIKAPNSSALDNAVIIPNDAAPVVVPSISSGTITMMSCVEDQNFTQPQLVILPTPAISTLSPSFEIFTTTNQVLNMDSSCLFIRGQLYTGGATQPTFDFKGTNNGSGFNWPLGGVFSLIQNMTIYMNGTALPNFQSGNALAQLYTHAAIQPRLYNTNTCFADVTQNYTTCGTLGINQFVGRPAQAMASSPFLDFGGVSTSAANTTTGITVYYQIPLKNLWLFYGEPGRFLTNDAKIRLNLVLSSLTMKGTQTMSLPLSMMGTDDANVPVSTALTNAVSQPVSMTITDMFLVMPLYNINGEFQDLIEAHVRESPLTFVMTNAEIYNEPAITNLDMTDIDNWGKGPIRTLIKGSGYLPHHCLLIPTVEATWKTTGTGANLIKPFNITDFTWSRSAIMPGMVYPRRIYLGGQPYYDDQVLATLGISKVLGAMNGWQIFVEKAARKFQQEGNYTDAPNQQWLNLYGNATQLSTATQLSLNFIEQNTALNPQEVIMGMNIGNWASGLGPIGMSLSQDVALDTLTIARTQSFEIEFYTMPWWGAGIGSSAIPNVTFMGIDNVWGKSAASLVNVPLIPLEVKMSLQHSLPYPMMVSFGRGRSCQYAYIGPEAPMASYVPM